MVKKSAKKKVPKKEEVNIEISPPILDNKRLDDKEIAKAFLVPETDIQRRAWFQLLDDSIESAINQTELPSLWNNLGLIAGAVGGQKALRDFKDALLYRFDKAYDILSDKPVEGQKPKSY